MESEELLFGCANIMKVYCSHSTVILSKSDGVHTFKLIVRQIHVDCIFSCHPSQQTVKHWLTAQIIPQCNFCSHIQFVPITNIISHLSDALWGTDLQLPTNECFPKLQQLVLYQPAACLLKKKQRNEGMHGNNTNIKIENHDSHLLEGNVAKMLL